MSGHRSCPTASVARHRVRPGQPARAARGRRSAVAQERSRNRARDSEGDAAAGHASAPPAPTSPAFSRPANTVGGDFYESFRSATAAWSRAVGDVAGKGSPASLLMALLLAMMRTLVDERLEAAELISRLNVQVCRQAPGNRFITLFYAVLDLQPAS